MEEETITIECFDEEVWRFKITPENYQQSSGIPGSEDIDNRKAFIEKLAYFEKTNRFRENERYKNSTFKDYLWVEYGLTYNQYWTEHLIFSKYLDDAREVGIEAVKKILKKRG